jgi:hypothetical protein
MCDDLDYMERTEADCYVCKKKIKDKVYIKKEWEIKPMVQDQTVFCSIDCLQQYENTLATIG